KVRGDNRRITGGRDDHPLSEHGPDLPPGGASLRRPPGAALRDLSRADARGVLFAPYPGATLGEYAALNSLAIERLLELLNAAAEAEHFAQRTASRSRSEGGEAGW